MEEREIFKEAIKKSSYSDFIGEAERIVKLKEGFEQKALGAGFDIEANREELISQARIVRGELGYLITFDEGFELDMIIDKLNKTAYAIKSLDSYSKASGIDVAGVMPNEINSFKDLTFNFLSSLVRIQAAHNLALQTTTERGEIDMLYRAYNIPQSFQNSYGIWISPQMESLCRWLYCRAKNNWDNAVIQDGKAGVGKSTFTLAAITTLADMFGQKLDFTTFKGLLFKESRSYCQNLIRKEPQYSQLWFDEAGNQFNKRSWWVSEQTDLINDLQLARFHGFTLWLLWGDWNLLDSDIRNYRATALISIKERGLAILRQFNENPHITSRSSSTDTKKRGKVLSSAHEAHHMLEQDFLTRMIIPFYEIQGKVWDSYWNRKTGASRTGVDLFSHSKTRDDFYKDFLVGLDNDFVSKGNKVNTELLKRYSLSVNQYMTMARLASKVAKATGTSMNRIFTRDDITDPQAGFIILDDVMVSYIQRIKAEFEGAKQIKKEEVKTDVA